MRIRRWVEAAVGTAGALAMCAGSALGAPPAANGVKWAEYGKGPGAFFGARAEDGALVLTKDRELRLPGTSKERAQLPEGTRLTLSSRVVVRAQGQRYDVLLWSGLRPADQGPYEGGGSGDDVSVIAIYPAGSTTPTDVAEVKTDRETYLDDKLISLGDDDAFVIDNLHLNAGEEFQTQSLFHLRNGRLQRIAEAAAQSSMGDGCKNVVRESIHWSSQPGPSHGWSRIVVEVETVRSPKEDITSCEGKKPKESRSRSTQGYGWDSAKNRYVPL